MRRVMKALIMTAVAAAISAPAIARAEGYVSPWAGVQFGSDVQNGRGSFGVHAGGMGAGIIGGGVGVGLRPRLFGTENRFWNKTVVDGMGHVLGGAASGGGPRRARRAEAC